MKIRKGTAAAAVAAGTSLVAVAVAGFATSPAAASSAATAAKCLHPKNTTVQVKEYEFGFTLTPSKVHCGKVKFVQKNTGSAPHNFDIQGVKGGKVIQPGTSTSFTVAILPRKSYSYLCDVLGHAQSGMVGAFKTID